MSANARSIDSLDSRFIEDFYRDVATGNGWEFKPQKPIETGGKGFFAKGSIGVNEGRSLKMVQSLDLYPSKDGTIFLVVLFVVDNVDSKEGVRLLNGAEVLVHCGKHYMGLGRPTHEYWTIQSPANLEALFRAYDNLARIKRLPTVFNLP